MTIGASVCQRVSRQMRQETSAGEFQSVERLQTLKKDTLQDGQLVWIAQSDTPSHDKKRAFRTSRGEKHLLSEEEIKRFTRTPYERGFNEFIYEGQIKHLKNMENSTDPRGSMRQGSGSLFYPNGSSYVGNWHHNKRHGVGCVSNHKGYRYAGDWRNDVPNGKGYEVFSCRAAIDANYENGSPQGEGVILYNPKLNAYRYEGEWKNGQRHGKGIIFYANGDTFACTFSYGKREGRGVTTQTVNGKLIQYETNWEDNKLVNGPKLIPKALRTPKPVSSIPYRTKGYLTAADITKWTVTGNPVDLPFEHFMQLKLGFESLDVVGCGFLPLKELHAVWPENNMEMLKKLEIDNREYVELLDIFSLWYPNVSPHNIYRFMQEFITPFDLLRIRGYLNGIEDSDSMGYYHIIGDTSPLNFGNSQHPPLQLRDLEAHEYRIGGEKFSSENYETARQFHDPPHLLDVLEVWYPNIMRVTLEQYEMEDVEKDIIDPIRVDFNRYARDISINGGYLLIDDFLQAETKYREFLLSGYRNNINSNHNNKIMTTPNRLTSNLFPETFSPSNSVEAEMRQGFQKGTVMWVLGNRIRINIPFLLEIENFYVSRKGQITFDELLRFCFPNVPCLRTQEALLDQITDTPCRCSLCSAIPG
ncbi:phosphatidylinositol-4-phosphate 5-kinase, partial [Trypanosoma theileri]